MLLSRPEARDPLTKQPLPIPCPLTPVFALKSRGHEYATETSRRCLEIACDFACKHPVAYLR